MRRGPLRSGMLWLQLLRRAVVLVPWLQGLGRVGDGTVRVAELRIYPVKSCRGISMASARLCATGLEWDRTFAFVDGAGVVQTQRHHRALATIRPSIDVAKDELALRAAGADAVITVSLTGTRRRDGVVPDVCRTRSGIEMPVFRYPAASKWLTARLRDAPGLDLKTGREVAPSQKQRQTLHLVRFDPSRGVERHVMDYIGGDFARQEDVVAFPDIFPLLVTATASLAELSRRVGGAVPMDRFRPNIVVDGGANMGPFEEDSWALVDVGKTTLRCFENNPRCQIPSIDQDTGEADARFEPTSTLRQFRRLEKNSDGRHGDLGDAGPMFGIYATHGLQRTELRVGDVLQVRARSKAGSLHEYWAARDQQQREND